MSCLKFCSLIQWQETFPHLIHFNVRGPSLPLHSPTQHNTDKMLLALLHFNYTANHHLCIFPFSPFPLCSIITKKMIYYLPVTFQFFSQCTSLILITARTNNKSTIVRHCFAYVVSLINSVINAQWNNTVCACTIPSDSIQLLWILGNPVNMCRGAFWIPYAH